MHVWVLRLIEASYHSVLGCDISVWGKPTASIFGVEDCSACCVFYPISSFFSLEGTLW